MLLHLRQCSGCRQVSLSARERYQAIRELVRPWEVAHLWLPRRPHRSPRPSTADEVAAWFRWMFRVGKIRYIPDLAGPDIWCSPSATLEREGGDCDDLSILAASSIESRNHRLVVNIAIGNLCTDLGCIGHAWVEGIDEDGWFLLEATSGELFRRKRPRDYRIHLLLNRVGLPRLA
jgi:transglutaminase-like putative cysteine protease